jgi:hypothetical protein
MSPKIMNIRMQPLRNDLCLNLCLQDSLKCLSISSEFADTLTELLNSHLVLVEVEAEQRFLIDVRLLLDIEGGGGGGIKLLGDVIGGV